MKLLERCEAVTAGLSKRNALKQESAKAAVFVTRSQEVRAVREELSVALAKMQVLRAHQIAIPRAKDVGGALDRLRGYQRALAEDAAASGPAHGIAKRSLDSVRKSVVESAQAALDKVISEVPGLEESFLRQVELNPAHKEQVRRIRLVRAELEKASKQATLEPAALKSFLERREVLRRLVDDLDPKDFPKEVLDFFKAARSAGGAPLERLTDSVRQWLSERGQLQNVRVIVVE